EVLGSNRALGTRSKRAALAPVLLPWFGAGGPVPHGRQDEQASSVLTFGQPTRPKKPIRRCFKPRPPLSAGCAGFASGCRSRSEVGKSNLRRLSGLLSGCLPIDTRPQARAKLGERHIIASNLHCKRIRQAGAFSLQASFRLRAAAIAATDSSPAGRRHCGFTGRFAAPEIVPSRAAASPGTGLSASQSSPVRCWLGPRDAARSNPRRFLAAAQCAAY